MSKSDLPREIAIDPAYERRVLRSLFPTRWWIPLAVAASLVLGFLAGRFEPEPRGREYLLLLHGGTPGHVEEYRRWARTAGVRGGEKLKDEVTVLGSAEAKRSIGGFFRIAARNREEAEALARTCPHLKYGGWIELREIERV
jgi:hypothetical protein